MSEVKTHGGKHTVVFTESNHRYKVDGEYKKGVTTILGILDKPGLIQWASNKACDWIRSYCEKISDAPRYSVSENDLGEAKYAHRTLKDEAAEVGKRVHKWIEDHIAGTDTEYDEQMKLSVESFLKWEEENKPEYINSERIVYSEELDICGTTDSIIILNGKRTILDFKTGHPDREYDSNKKVYSGRVRGYTTVYMQDALYDIGVSEEDKVKADQYGVLYLPTDGGAFMFLTEETEHYREMAKLLVQFEKMYNKADKFINEYERK